MTADDTRFFPCNPREAWILVYLSDDKLEKYKLLRNQGATVTDALEKTEHTPRFRGKMKIKRCWKCPFIGESIGLYFSECNHPDEAAKYPADRLNVRRDDDDPIPEECPLSKVPHDL